MSSGEESFESVSLPSPSSQTIDRGFDRDSESEEEAIQGGGIERSDPNVTARDEARSARRIQQAFLRYRQQQRIMSQPQPKTKPVFGGLYGDGTKAVWIGGPPLENWNNTSLSAPTTPMCIRGDDPSSEMKAYSKRVLEGNEIKFKRDDPDYPLLSFAADAKTHMETYGMDSVFYMKGTSTAIPDGEELFTYHNKYTTSGVKNFIETQKNNNVYDKYALDTLKESSSWLINSLDDTLKTSLRNQIRGNVPGPLLWMIIVSEVQHQSLKRASNLEDDFKKCKLSDFKGENVREYCDKVSAILYQLDKDGELPRLCLIRIIDAFCACTVLDFRVRFMGRRSEVEKFLRDSAGKDKAAIAQMNNYIDYDTLLTEGKEAYADLTDQWGPAKAAKEAPNALLSKFKALESKLDQALTKQNNNNSSSTNNGGRNNGKRKCFNCGSEDHLAKDCPKKKDTNTNKSNNGGGGNDDDDFRNLPAPKEGEPTKKQIKGGKTIYYCSKCRRGKGVWNDTHETADHVNGWVKQNKDKSTDPSASAKVAAVDQSLFSSWFE